MTLEPRADADDRHAIFTGVDKPSDGSDDELKITERSSAGEAGRLLTDCLCEPQCDENDIDPPWHATTSETLQAQYIYIYTSDCVCLTWLLKQDKREQSLKQCFHCAKRVTELTVI